MNEEPIDDSVEEIEATPSDEFFQVGGGRRRLRLASLATVLRALSGTAAVLAFACAAGILALDAAHLIRPDVSWRVKSALPLICVGVSYALLQFTVPLTLTGFCLSLSVSLGFILWGVEQYIAVARIAGMVDDVVVFIFVMDLGLVIRGRLKQERARKRE
jgi:hypothetical protein